MHIDHKPNNIHNKYPVPIDQLNKVYTHQKIEFTRSQRGEQAIHVQHEITLTILLLELSIKEQIVEQREQLYKELYHDNSLKF